MFSCREEALGYLAGIIDGEGCVTASSRNMSVRISNTDSSIIEATRAALDLLGIEYTIGVKEYAPHSTWKSVQIIKIYRLRNFKKLSEVPLKSAAKRAQLQQILDTHKGDRIVHRPNRERLFDLLEKGKTHREIAEIMGFRSHSNVQYWIDKYLSEAA